MNFRISLVSLVVWLTFITTRASNSILQVVDDEKEVTISNSFVCVTFDKGSVSINKIFADYSGEANYTTNVLALPFSLSTKLLNSAASCASSFSSYSITTHTDEIVELRVSDIKDCVDSPLAQENWIISLRRSQRFFQVHIQGGTTGSSSEVVSIGHSIFTGAASVFGLFERGVVQMMNNQGKCLGSDQPLERVYMLGNSQSLDVLYKAFPHTSTSLSAQSLSGPQEIVLYSKSSSALYGSGVQDVLVGEYPRKSLEMETAWSSKCWEEAVATEIKASEPITWEYMMSLGPNNMDFPVYPVPYTDSAAAATAGSTSLIPLMTELDIRTFLTGVYANPVGCLQSYYNLRDGTIAPTVSHPDVGYSPNTNFFDPDNFISVSAMMYSGDDYLMREVKKVLERTAETMCGVGKDADASYCDAGMESSTRRHPTLSSTLAVTHPSFASSQVGVVKQRTGQLMHHFINLKPTYESIATSEQLGPNVFWTLSAIRYASLNHDPEWLQKMLPFFELSARYLASFFDEVQGLLLVPGPLWIDVVVRENYTSDSNAIAPYIFRKLAEVFESLSTLPDFSVELRRMADRITVAMNDLLWDTSSNDHYITQLNADLTTTRDFIDYDSNLLAVAFGVAPDARVSSLLHRVDSGAYTHVRGTWCCEIPYSGDREDCYIVGGSVCGDSVVTLGRIGWADSHARKRVGDLETFNTLLLSPLQQDLVRDTWLYERYDSKGNQIRTSYYFEYPALVTMMLTEIRFGIDVTLSSVKVDPFPAADFTFSFGSLVIKYSQATVELHLKISSTAVVTKTISIHGLAPNISYDLLPNSCTTKGQSFATSFAGVLSFDYQIRSDCPIILTKSSSNEEKDSNGRSMTLGLVITLIGVSVALVWVVFFMFLGFRLLNKSKDRSESGGSVRPRSEWLQLSGEDDDDTEHETTTRKSLL